MSLSYGRSYPEVLILNYTYKTNKYRMPLLNIININAYTHSFYIAFAFLTGKEEVDFI
jgi:hypothetical protein